MLPSDWPLSHSSCARKRLQLRGCTCGWWSRLGACLSWVYETEPVTTKAVRSSLKASEYDVDSVVDSVRPREREAVVLNV